MSLKSSWYLQFHDIYPSDNFKYFLSFQFIYKYPISDASLQSDNMAFAIPTSLKKNIDDTKVEYVQLGTSGLRVSLPILGAMSLGSSQWDTWILDEAKSLEILKAAYDVGITTWDTANAYSNGLSEEAIGKAIKTFSLPREKVVIMTKIWAYVAEEVNINGFMFGQQMQGTKEYVNQGGKRVPSRATLAAKC